jgi:2-haloacid dehalogenase
VKLAVFDIGNVLIRWDPENLYRKLIPDPAERRAFLDQVITKSWQAEQDRGRPFARAVAELSALHPEKAGLIAAFHGRWTEMLDGPIEQSVAVMAELKSRGRPVYGISNFSTETFPVALKLFPFLNDFDGLALSGTLGLIKPDPDIYLWLFKTYSLSPRDLVFIDDVPANVETAERLGMTGILFSQETKLRLDLERLGVL